MNYGLGFRVFTLVFIFVFFLLYFVLAPYWMTQTNSKLYKRIRDLKTIAKLNRSDDSNLLVLDPDLEKLARNGIQTSTSSTGTSNSPSVYADESLDVQFRTEYEKLKCKFAVLNPWDTSILPFLYHPQPLACPRVQPDLTYIDDHGFLRFDHTEYTKTISTYRNISCYYQQLDKMDDNDHSLMYIEAGKYFTYSDAIRLKHETVEVKCFRVDSKTGQRSIDQEHVYWQIHTWPMIVSNSSLRSNDKSLSVLVLILDSVSTSSFKRHFPLTYGYLRDVMGFHMFYGHHKIGDNSFPNHMSLLMGKRVADEHWPDMMDEVGEDYKRIRFDHWPLIWRRFEEKGYETSFNEDTPHWGLFHYFLKGFLKKPVRHYYHQFWIALRNIEHKFMKFCFGNKAKLEIQLDIVRRELRMGRNRKWFNYVCATELFHQDEGFQSEVADPYLLKFFREMYEGGYFNDTAIMFMADHGHRYASLRRTLVGLLEDRLPMLNIWFPQWFYKGNDFNATLHSNTIRLTSQFDVHETLLDILHENYEGTQRSVGTRGLSLLYPLPRDRTCPQAGIPEHYCTCLSQETLSPNHSSAIDASIAAIDHLNNLLSNFSQCSSLSLSKIVRVEGLGVNEGLARGLDGLKSVQEFEAQTNAPSIRPLNKLRVTFVTDPGQAMFEATTTKTNWETDWTVDGRMYRLNSYQNTSTCIRHTYLVNFCVCRKNVGK